MFVLILPFLVHLAYGGSSQPELLSNLTNATWRDLLDFLRTREQIWLKAQKIHLQDTDCTVWIHFSTHNNTYEFQEMSRRGGLGSRKKSAFNKFAKLKNNTQQQPVMEISYHGPKPPPPVVLTLIFWIPNEKCSIFNSTKGGYEQRVWKSHLENSTLCDKIYNVLTRGSSILIYKPSCLNPNYLCVGVPTYC
uniref:Putative lipocalin-3 1 n=1 Tax=Rhipicephalus microplus TaxID=6941 RepID=A0A6M2CYU2_RHIMP